MDPGGRLAAGGDGGVEDGHVAGEDPRAGGRLDAFGRDHVLERDRDAGPVGVVDRPQVGVQLVVALADRVEVRGVQLGGRDLAPVDEPDRLLGREPQRVDHGRHAPSAPPLARARESAGADPPARDHP